MSVDAPPTLRRLDQSQLSQFDTHYIVGPRLDAIGRMLAKDFPDDELTVLDVGGGNGTFADQLLERYAGVRVTVLDNAPELLRLNRPHPRKELVEGSVTEMSHLFRSRRFDVISFNFSIHHFVEGSYAGSRRAQAAALREACALLSERGRISIFENVCEGFILPAFSGWFIYRLTASRALAPFVRRLGANTAGCGVLFLTERAIVGDAKAAGAVVNQIEDDTRDKPLSSLKRALLLMRVWRVRLYWLAAAARAQ